MRRSFPSVRLWPVAVLLAATACAEPAAPDSATATATASDVASPPVTPPPMAVEPPPRRLPGNGDASQRCDADAAREVVGREATADLVEEARSAAGADRVRVLEPGQMVTMEYHPSRLTLDVDARNVVVNVRCG